MSILEYVPGTMAWRRRRDRELCRQTGERIQEIVDGEFPPGRAKEELERHLEACERCQGGAETIRELKGAIARVGSGADEALVARLHETAERLCTEGDPGFVDGG